MASRLLNVKSAIRFKIADPFSERKKGFGSKSMVSELQFCIHHPFAGIHELINTSFIHMKED